jgi:CheY-like chemotaxis protein
MAMFGMKKSKPSEGAELVLAYLEEAQRLRAPLTLAEAKGRSVTATLANVSEDRITLSLQGTLTVDKGAAVDLFFILDGLRFKASTRAQEIKGGSAALDLPSALSLAERRKKPRARLNAREGATGLALTGLFDGVGATGIIESISEGGLCLRVERAMEVKTQRKMHMGANLLPVGQPLMLIKLSKLPKCPPIELGGTVAWVEAGHGLLVGITFEPGKGPLLAPVKSLVASRTSAIPTSVPPKARRQPEPERKTETEPTASKPAPRKESESAPKGAPAAQPTVTPAPPLPAEAIPETIGTKLSEAGPATGPEPVDERALALLRVKKRTRGILLVMPTGPEREALTRFLNEDGYGRVLFADSLADLLDHLDRPGIHLILVDGGVTELKDLALASLVRHKLEDAMPPLILAEPHVDAELVLGARELGLAQILVKPYELDAEFTSMIEGHLGIG